MTNATEVKGRPILFSSPMVRAVLSGSKSQTRRVAKVPGWADHVEVKTIDSTTWIDAHGRHPKLGGCVKTVWNPYGDVGDRLWVRETWSPDHVAFYPNFPVVYAADNGVDVENGQVFSPEANASYPFRWRPSIHMPRRHSRITLEITEVRVQRLNEISEDDAIAEGLEVQMGDGTGPGPGFKWNGPGYWDGFSQRPDWGKTYHVPAADGLCCCYVGQRERLTPAVCAFRHLWDKINGKRPGCDWQSNPYVWAISFRRLP